MEWISLPKKSEDHTHNLDNFIYTSKVALFRNFDAYPFPRKLSAEKRSLLEDKFLTIINESNLDFHFYCLPELEKNYVDYLIQTHIIPSYFLDYGKYILFDPEIKWILLLNSKNHLEIYNKEYGYHLASIYKNLSTILNQLETSISFSFDEKLGYLTASPNTIGTALSLKVSMNLFGLCYSKKLKSLKNTLEETGYTLTPFTKDKKNTLFYLENNYSLGLSEKEMLEEVTELLKRIQKMEYLERNKILEDKADKDKIFENIFLIKNQLEISWEELCFCISALEIFDNTTLEIKDKFEFRNILFETSDDILFYKESISVEKIPFSRSRKLQSLFRKIKFKKIN